jgi:crotonobetainyl-CoA:carnitine CoA-transferase CaiB-like acyl-CoA transferase
LIAALAGWTKAALLPLLDAAAVPASPINDIAEMFADPQTVARGLRMGLDDGHGNHLPSVRAPMLMTATPLTYDRASPRLGEHTGEILAELDRREEKTS